MTDTALKTRLDHLVEAEVVQGFRVVDVPYTVQRVLEEARQIDPEIPDLKKVRFTKLTPKKRSMVSEAVLSQYHDDLKNEKILSKAKIRELNISRGQWSEAKEKTIDELQRSTNKIMQDLSVDGFDREQVWRNDIAQSTDAFLKELRESNKPDEEKQYLEEIFWRWINYTPAQKEEYTKLYAASQGKEEYSVDTDLAKLYDVSTSEAGEMLSKIDDTQYNLARYVQLFNERQQLVELLQEQALMFAQSVETRRENTEELARLFYGCQVIHDDGPATQITNTLDKFWDLPEELVAWLMEESYFFYNGIPKAIREHMDEWGFTTAGRESGLLALSDESLAPPSSSTDTTQSEETPSDSSELTPPKTSESTS